VAQPVLTICRRQLRTFRHRVVIATSFSGRDWRVFLEALITLTVVKIALHTTDIRRNMAWAGRIRGAPLDRSRQEVERIAWLVEGASRLLFLRCLPRSLALVRVLSRRNVAATMRIGVQTVNGKLLAHAWVEWQGRALNDDERSLQDFAAFEHLRGDASSA
jgi:hypothetical protein